MKKYLDNIVITLCRFYKKKLNYFLTTNLLFSNLVLIITIVIENLFADSFFTKKNSLMDIIYLLNIFCKNHHFCVENLFLYS